MKILTLAALEPGDVILEAGLAAVASATNGPYGHASIALGKLVKIKAGKDEGVVIAPFDLAAYNRNGDRLVGMPLRDGDAVIVLRRKLGLDIGEIDGNALWEAGRAYDLHRALDLPDLDAEVKRKLVAMLARRGAAPDADGRMCSEMAARILGLPASNVSPNALADAEQLEEVEDAIVTLDGSWTLEGTNTATDALVQMVTRIEVGLAREVTTLAGDLAAVIKKKKLSKAAAGEQLTKYVGSKLHEAILALVAIRNLENTVLHLGTDKV